MVVLRGWSEGGGGRGWNFPPHLFNGFLINLIETLSAIYQSNGTGRYLKARQRRATPSNRSLDSISMMNIFVKYLKQKKNDEIKGKVKEEFVSIVIRWCGNGAEMAPESKIVKKEKRKMIGIPLALYKYIFPPSPPPPTARFLRTIQEGEGGGRRRQGEEENGGRCGYFLCDFLLSFWCCVLCC